MIASSKHNGTKRIQGTSRHIITVSLAPLVGKNIFPRCGRCVETWNHLACHIITAILKLKLYFLAGIISLILHGYARYLCTHVFITYINMAASQNARSGSTPKTHRRSRPAIQTDPDLTIQTDPDLWSRPLCFMLVGNFLFQSTEKYYSVLQSTVLLQYYFVLLQYYSVLQSTMLGDLVNFGKIWPSRSRPRSGPFQTRSRPVPWNPRAVSLHSHFAKKTKQVRASSAESFDSV